jgi:hypothetical protein
LSGLDFSRIDLMAGFRLFFDPPGMTLEEHDRQVPFTIDLPKFI